MEIAPIKTEANYEAALEELETLMNTKPDSPEGDRLDLLTALVEVWEETNHN